MYFCFQESNFFLLSFFFFFSQRSWMRYFAFLLRFSVNALAGVENLVKLLWPSVLQAKPRPKIKFKKHVTVIKHHENIPTCI